MTDRFFLTGAQLKHNWQWQVMTSEAAKLSRGRLMRLLYANTRHVAGLMEKDLLYSKHQ